MKPVYYLMAKTKSRMSTIIVDFFKKVAGRIVGLFEPEEVEVTFQVKGKNTIYTYTKVEAKQVA
jgi:hypothetical protein